MSDPFALDSIAWDNQGLIAAIAQDATTGEVLMLAWMDRSALSKTLESGFAVYYSRSRQALWHKGEQSGHRQRVLAVRLDCDRDAILLKVEQIGGIACHTGRRSCFFSDFEDGQWVDCEPVLKDPKEMYGE